MDKEPKTVRNCGVVVGCMGDGTKRVGPCQDGQFYRVECHCENCSIRKKEQDDRFKSLEDLFYSVEFGHVDGHEWSMDDKSLMMLWDWIQANDCSPFAGCVTSLEGQMKEIALHIHYPECWDTTAYPTLASAVTEITYCDPEQCTHNDTND